MSSNTKNLGLLKKDPGTDGAETFNIKTMMNDNWDKIDAAVPGVEVKDAPAGTDHMFLYDNAAAGKPKKVLLSKLVELWKKTFYTKEDTDSLLSKKADTVNVVTHHALPAAGDNMDLHKDVFGLLPVNPPQSGSPTANAPEDVSWGTCLSVTYGVTRQLLLMDLAGLHYQVWDGLTWGPWVQIATATPPQEYDLPLAAGWSTEGRCRYYKNQFNVVTIELDVNSESYTGGKYSLVATLPEGFRPTRTEVLTGSILKYDLYETIKTAQFVVDVQGNISIRCPVFDGHVYARVIGGFLATNPKP